MIRKIKYLTFLFLIAPVLSSYGQEIVTGLGRNPRLLDAWQKRDLLKSDSPMDTVGLPFFDDFIPKNIFPSNERWADDDVYINNTYPVNQLSQGVATFDALDYRGLLYKEAGPLAFEADHLTSAPIDLDVDPSENVFLSFFYQPQGIADQPELQDSLVLQFYSAGDNEWHHVWKAEGRGLHNFKPVIIKIDNPLYLYRGFRFRFINYASISSDFDDQSMAGNADHWNIDYVYLDRNRSFSDTIPADVAFTRSPGSVLNTYESMPWEQFKNVFLSEMGSFIKINYRNNDKVTRNVTRNFTIRDMYEGTGVHAFSAGATNIEPDEWVTYNANLIYTFNSPYTDSAMFRIRSVLITDDFDPKVNDTIDYYQVFSNYFSYDDGSAESGYGINGQGASNAMVSVRYRTFEPDTLRAVMIAFNDSYRSSNQRYFNIAVWDDDNGMPGELLYEQEEMADPGENINEFMQFRLNDPLPVDAYFHIGWIQQSETFLNVSLDMNTLPEGRRHYYINGVWSESEVAGSLMIRPVMGSALIPSGIDDICPQINKRINIWPNPVKNILNIEIPDNDLVMGIDINIYDNYGRWLMSETQTPRVNVTSLPPGVYLIIISSGNKVIGYNRFIRL
ncbi:MAG TPA: T9SS type A sorting domain-containing protein [Bacteroidetes bacterium]|nr:T9SS type A sorting domain-containing protein [Bacteroidota bacterium]